MLAFRRNRITTGLDIGSRFIKLVAADHSGVEPEIVKVSVIPVPTEAIADGEVVDRSAVAGALRSAVRDGGHVKGRLVAAIGGHEVIVKKIAMDRMDVADAREAIRWDARAHVPFDMDSVQLDFQILDPDAEGPEMSVLLVAAKRDLVEARLALLAEAGLEPDILDVDAFALHNALERNHPDAMQGLVALLDVGHEVTRLELLADGVPALVRTIPFGTRRLTDGTTRVSAAAFEGPDGAETGHDVSAGASDLVERFGHAPDPARTAELVSAVERTVAFVSQEEAAPLGRVFVCGGGARVPGVLEAFGARLRVRTEAANPVQRIRVRPDVAAAVPLDELAPLLMLPIGLALRTAAGGGRERPA